MIITAAMSYHYFGLCTACGHEWSGDDRDEMETCPACGHHCHKRRIPDAIIVKDETKIGVPDTKIQCDDLSFSCEMDFYQTQFDRMSSPHFSAPTRKKLGLSVDLRTDSFSGSRNGKPCKVTESLLKEVGRNLDFSQFPKGTLFHVWSNRFYGKDPEYRMLRELLEHRYLLKTLWEDGDHGMVFLQSGMQYKMVNEFGSDAMDILGVSEPLFRFFLDWWPYLNDVRFSFILLRKFQEIISDDELIQALLWVIELHQAFLLHPQSMLMNLAKIFAFRPDIQVQDLKSYIESQVQAGLIKDPFYLLQCYEHYLRENQNTKNYELYPADLLTSYLVKEDQKPKDCGFSSALNYENDAYRLEFVDDPAQLSRLMIQVPESEFFKFSGENGISYYQVKGKRFSPMALFVVAVFHKDNMPCAKCCFPYRLDPRNDGFMSMKQELFIREWAQKNSIQLDI